MKKEWPAFWWNSKVAVMFLYQQLKHSKQPSHSRTLFGRDDEIPKLWFSEDKTHISYQISFEII
jgi:hypothetical protein